MKTFVVFIVFYLMLIHSILVFGFDGWKLVTRKDGSVVAHTIQNKPETLSQVELYILVPLSKDWKKPRMPWALLV